MDLIYTNGNRVDQGVLSSHAFDLSYGASENDFELALGADEPALESGAYIYIENTEYGGEVGGIKASTNGETITYYGRTWHGILNSKVIEPDAGEDYLIVNGDANEILAMFIDRLGLGGLFVAKTTASEINVKNNKIHRYCKAYDGITAMLGDVNAKLKFKWENRTVTIWAELVTDYTDSPIDDDIATLTVERHDKKVNHLVCLGAGVLAAREVIHLYVDQFGRIGDHQYYFGLDEICDTYENVNAESSEALRDEGIKRLKELRNNDKAEIALPETEGLTYDIGDIVSATELKSGIRVTTSVTQKIVKIKNGAINTDYKTGG